MALHGRLALLEEETPLHPTKWNTTSPLRHLTGNQATGPDVQIRRLTHSGRKAPGLPRYRPATGDASRKGQFSEWNTLHADGQAMVEFYTFRPRPIR